MRKSYRPFSRARNKYLAFIAAVGTVLPTDERGNCDKEAFERFWAKYEHLKSHDNFRVLAIIAIVVQLAALVVCILSFSFK